MNPQAVLFLQILAYIGIVIGLIGTVAPIIPGTLVIWFSVLLWAWTDGFDAVGWPTLVFLAMLAIAAEIGDLLFASWGAKKGGASWKSLFVAGVCAIAGLLIFNLIGAIVGAVLGMLAWEAYRRDWKWREAWGASRGLIFGYVIAMLFKVTMGVMMVATFAWQAFYAG